MRKYVTDCCELFYRMTGLPIALFDSSGQLQTVFPFGADRIAGDAYSGIFSKNKNPDTYISASQGVYGRIQMGIVGTVIVGPAYSVPIKDDVVRAYLREKKCSMEHWNAAKSMLQQTEQMNFQKFTRCLTFLHFCLNREKVDVLEHYDFANLDRYRDISVLQTKESSKAKENGISHNTYDYEQNLFAHIKAGDTKRLLEFMVHNNTVNMYRGDLSKDPLRNAQNRFVVAVTKVGVLSALPGKLDRETTYQLIDSYIRECDQRKTVAEIERLEYIMVMDFCQRISASRAPRGISREIYSCMNYIRENAHEHISVNDVARYVGRSQSYLNTHFREEMGLTVSSYIMRCKLEEAARLLEFSDQTLAEISCFLNFSSQSYFQNLFKKEYGVTPMQYRKNNQR